ncbi:hypothetical protein sos41_14010 [Alphaproteobacteria bacterium SO-S41]|nr:hypothetical protein sos41_14010 [Alphaproteobacteria bacterium SO-S41]
MKAKMALIGALACTFVTAGCSKVDKSAIEACALQIFREHEDSYDTSKADMIPWTDATGQNILREGSQVYHVAIPRVGYSVVWRPDGMVEHAFTCLLYKSPESGRWTRI